MALGQKRTCYSCGAKFYDLEQDPAKCPKCETENMLDGNPRTKKGRKSLAESVDDDKLDDIEIGLDDIEEIEDIEEDDDHDVSADLDIRGKVDVEDGDAAIREDTTPDKVLDLEGDHDVIIDTVDDEDEEDTK